LNQMLNFTVLGCCHIKLLKR